MAGRVRGPNSGFHDAAAKQPDGREKGGPGPTRCRPWTLYAAVLEAASGGASADTTEALGDGEEAASDGCASCTRTGCINLDRA